MSAYNIGMGASVAVGPLLVALLYDSLGQEGMVWLFAGCYGLAALLTLAFRPTDERSRTGNKTRSEEKNLVPASPA